MAPRRLIVGESWSVERPISCVKVTSARSLRETVARKNETVARKKNKKKTHEPKRLPPGGSNGREKKILHEFTEPPERPGDGKIRTFAAPPAPIAPGVSRKRENMCVTIATTAGGQIMGQIHAQTPESEHHGHRAQNLSPGHSLRCELKKANPEENIMPSEVEQPAAKMPQLALPPNHVSPPRFSA